MMVMMVMMSLTGLRALLNILQVLLDRGVSRLRAGKVAGLQRLT